MRWGSVLLLQLAYSLKELTRALFIRQIYGIGNRKRLLLLELGTTPKLGLCCRCCFKISGVAIDAVIQQGRQWWYGLSLGADLGEIGSFTIGGLSSCVENIVLTLSASGLPDESSGSQWPSGHPPGRS